MKGRTRRKKKTANLAALTIDWFVGRVFLLPYVSYFLDRSPNHFGISKHLSYSACLAKLPIWAAGLTPAPEHRQKLKFFLGRRASCRHTAVSSCIMRRSSYPWFELPVRISTNEEDKVHVRRICMQNVPGISE